VCDLSCSELLERLERLERAGPSSDLVEYFYIFADAIVYVIYGFSAISYIPQKKRHPHNLYIPEEVKI
jgi:hypothetical protein